MTLVVDARLRRGAFALDARFEAPLDGVTVLFGPSGAGKSLLLSAIAGLARLDAGRIVLGGRDVSATPTHQRGVGLVFQDARLFPHLSVRENLAYAAQRAPAARLGLEQAASLFDIAALLERRVRNLSGGEKARVALARALLSAPDLLLLDEPFAALDGARRQRFLTLLKTLHAQFALPMIVVTHQIEDAAYLADHVVALKAGRVIASGPMQTTATMSAFQDLLDARDIGAALPALALASASGGAWVRADHVLLATAQPQGLSARNVWPGEILSLHAEETAVLVTVRTPVGVLVARVTRSAMDELALAPGLSVWAIVKAHSV